MIVSASGAMEVSSVAMTWYLSRQNHPQQFLLARIGAFYICLRRVGMLMQNSNWRLLVRAIGVMFQRYSEMGLITYLIMTIARSFPDVVYVPETWTGKDLRTGSFPPFFRAFWFPYTSAEVFILRRVWERVSRTEKPIIDKYNLVHSANGESLYMGMWPGYLHDELPPDIDFVLDLTNEYTESAEVTQGRAYVCSPIWDQAAPLDKERFIRDINRAATFRGNVYVHCGFGVGRSAIAVICILMKRGLVTNYEDGLKMVKKCRPYAAIKAHHVGFMKEMSERFLSK